MAWHTSMKQEATKLPCFEYASNLPETLACLFTLTFIVVSCCLRAEPGSLHMNCWQHSLSIITMYLLTTLMLHTDCFFIDSPNCVVDCFCYTSKSMAYQVCYLFHEEHPVGWDKQRPTSNMPLTCSRQTSYFPSSLRVLVIQASRPEC